MEQHPERIIVSVGGSLIVPGDIDTAFLRTFTNLVAEKVREGFSFYIITGGGKVCRQYQHAAKAVRDSIGTDALDWIGIASTRLNAELVRSLFGDAPPVIQDASAPINSAAPVLIAGGIHPGNSSDWAAVEAAKAVGAKKLVNLSNIDYVYTKDPRTNPDAEKIEKIGWADFRKLIPAEWDPGMSSPFDPVAAKDAESMGLEVAIMNGALLSEFSNYLSGKPFIGTVIS